MAQNIILSKIKDRFPLETLNDAECILCKEENVAICRYCFSIALIRVLKELNFTENLIEKFQYGAVHDEIFK